MTAIYPVMPDETTPEQVWLEQVIASQAEMQQPEISAEALKTRYIFNPFLDKELTLDQMQLLGGYPELKAGRILPFPKYQMRDKDYRTILNVPRDGDGNFLPVNEGVSADKLQERVPAEVLQAIFEIFNQHWGINGVQNNGICEVEILRGSDDMRLCLALNRHCLPIVPRTAEEQLAQLTRAKEAAPEQIYADVAERLIVSTNVAVRHLTWQYGRLQDAMENPARSGKWELSPFDGAMCRWLGRPEPRRRSNLAGSDTSPQQVVVKMEGQQGAQQTDIERKACPRCAEMIAADANYCRFCNLTLGESAQPKLPKKNP